MSKISLVTTIICAVALAAVAFAMLGCKKGDDHMADGPGMVNPMILVKSADEVQQATGIRLPLPEGAAGVKYIVYNIADGDRMAEARFSWSDYSDCALRAQKTAADSDISGLYYEKSETIAAPSDPDATLTVYEGNLAGTVTWYDAKAGVQYCMTILADEPVPDMANELNRILENTQL